MSIQILTEKERNTKLRALFLEAIDAYLSS
jgi:hypothetical protein